MKVIYDSTLEENGVVNTIKAFGRDLIPEYDDSNCVFIESGIFVDHSDYQNFYIRDGILVEKTDDEKNKLQEFENNLNTLYSEYDSLLHSMVWEYNYNGNVFSTKDISNISNMAVSAMIDTSFTSSFLDIDGVSVPMTNQEVKDFYIAINNFKKDQDDIIDTKLGDITTFLKTRPVIV